MSYLDPPPHIPSRLPSTIYGAAWEGLKADPKHTVLFLTASAVHALAHGAVAGCAALLARALASDGRVSSSLTTLTLPTVVALGFGAVVLKGAAGTLATFSQSRLSSSTAQRVREGVIHAVLSNGLHTNTQTAIARLASQVREAQSAVHEGVLAWLRAVAQLGPILLALWILSPTLTALSVLVLAPFALVLSAARRKWRRWQQESMATADALHEEVDDLVRHADLWRTFGTGRHIRTVVRDVARRAGDAQTRSETFRAALSSMNEALAALALLLAIGAASVWAWFGAENLIAFAAVFFMAYKPLRDLGDGRAALVRGQGAMASLQEVAVPAGETEPPRMESRSLGLLEVDRVGIPERSPLISFDLAPGRILALTGPTGCGKTSLLRALLGLEQATGEIRFCGKRLLEGVGPQAKPFAWVPQDAPVVSGSLDDNFALAGVQGVDGEAELRSLGASNLGERIANVKLGAGGRLLSGGERRWIALARALATREPVLLLDEPTVGLDPESKRNVLNTLDALRGMRSLVIVTHDPDVVALADQVVDLANRPATSTCNEPSAVSSRDQNPQSAIRTSDR